MIQINYIMETVNKKYLKRKASKFLPMCSKNPNSHKNWFGSAADMGHRG